jgi:hypothetical protein
LDDDGSGGGRCKTRLIGGDIGDGVGCYCAGVDLHGVRFDAVNIGGDAEVEVLLGTGGLLAFFGWSIILVEPAGSDFDEHNGQLRAIERNATAIKGRKAGIQRSNGERDDILDRVCSGPTRPPEDNFLGGTDPRSRADAGEWPRLSDVRQ